MAAEQGVELAAVAGTGKDGRVTKGDMIAHLEAAPTAPPAPTPPAPPPSAPPAAPAIATVVPLVQPGPRPARPPRADEERVKMTRLRRTVADRLKLAQNTAAMLTTFNEADMSRAMAMRERMREEFEKKHGVRLGFMSFFVKACIVALKEIPAVNGEIDGDEIVYKNHYDIGVAVGAPQGLVVPVLRDADKLSFSEIEKGIGALGQKARDGKLAMADLAGGTFTISNGGIYGSLLSTPILNTPQSGILGMHKIQKRPVAIGDKVEVRPMMYLAFSYDHRIIDGREAVTFLVRVKENIEDPERLLFDL
jgi:2-oxoglutarate dehydrogenase E2 component (dihydrolipoamide succinyltransferase)